MPTRGRANWLNAKNAAIYAGYFMLPLAGTFPSEPETSGRAVARDRQSDSAPSAILRGHVKNADGTPLPGVRIRIAVPAADMRFVDPTTSHRQLETKTDARGDYRLEILEIKDS